MTEYDIIIRNGMIYDGSGSPHYRGDVAIQGDKLFGVENTCTLSKATPVREMNAELYDAKCNAEGTTYAYRVMLMGHANGVYVIEDGFASEWIACP